MCNCTLEQTTRRCYKRQRLNLISECEKWGRYSICHVAQMRAYEAIRPKDRCKSIDLLVFSCTRFLSRGRKFCWVETVGPEPYFKCLKVGGIESPSGCQAARCGGSLWGQLNKSDKKSANTERDDTKTQTQMRDKTGQVGATSGPFADKQKLHTIWVFFNISV